MLGEKLSSFVEMIPRKDARSRVNPERFAPESDVYLVERLAVEEGTVEHFFFGRSFRLFDSGNDSVAAVIGEKT